MRIGEFSKVFWATGVMINPQHFLYALPLLFYFCFAYFVYKKNSCFGTINIKLSKKFFFLIVCIGLLLFSSLSIVYNTQNSNKILIRNSIEFVEDYGLVDAFVVNSTYPLIKCFLPAEIEKNAIIEEKITYNREIHQYTNVYEDKNLIFILGESIAPYAIDQQLTPTLYKMKEEGKYFSSYYATRLNTLNSEYAVLNSFYLTSEREKSKFDSNGTMPKLFKNNGYTTQAFHDYDGAFYYRNMTMLEMGFDAFYDQHDLKTTGDFIDPSGDEEMFLRSFDYLSNKDPFFAFYITFSAHMPYNEEKRLSLEENLKIVKEVYPEYSESSQVYLASAMETDQGLDVLFTQMELEGILDNTVVAFVGDHYPYAISDDDLQKDFGVINDLNIYKVPFMIWDNNIEPEQIDKQMSMIDILPTIANTFNLSLDYTMGKDVFSSEEPIVEWYDNRAYSFVNETGYYDGLTGKTAGNLTVEDVERIKKYSYDREMWNDSVYVRTELLEITGNVKRKFYD